eukprot:s33_g68.t1
MGCSHGGCVSSHGLFKLIADRIERKCMTHKQKFHRLDSKATLSERYRKTSQILGAGLSGAVFLGEDESGRKVAIKTLRSGLCVKDPAKMVKHLSREVELLLSVKHPHVVELLDAFEGPSSLTIVTELLEGAVHVADVWSLKQSFLPIAVYRGICELNKELAQVCTGDELAEVEVRHHCAEGGSVRKEGLAMRPTSLATLEQQGVSWNRTPKHQSVQP